MQASLPGAAERAAIEAQMRDRPMEEALEAADCDLVRALGLALG
jgi:hypothetical protein